MKRVIIVLLCLLPTLAVSAPDCICRADGVVAYEGQIVCLTTPNGQQLARCDKVLNNTSWRFLQQHCDDKISDPLLAPSRNTTALTQSQPEITVK